MSQKQRSEKRGSVSDAAWGFVAFLGGAVWLAFMTRHAFTHAHQMDNSARGAFAAILGTALGCALAFFFDSAHAGDYRLPSIFDVGLGALSALFVFGVLLRVAREHDAGK
jgi:uncharacterized membrane protein YccC